MHRVGKARPTCM